MLQARDIAVKAIEHLRKKESLGTIIFRGAISDEMRDT